MNTISKYRFHPLSLLLCVLLLPIVLLYTNDFWGIASFVALSSAVLLVYKRYTRLIKFIALFALFMFLNEWLVSLNNQTLITYIGVTLYMFSRLLPVMMISSCLMSDVKPGELISTLQGIKLSKGIIFSFIVALRFVPIYFNELQLIRSSLKMRGVKLSIFKPIKAMEYLLVPVLFRGSLISEEMSSSAVTKAALAPYERTSLSEINWKWIDTSLVTTASIAAITCILRGWQLF